MIIECKGLELKTIKDFIKYIVLSNHDTPLRIEMGDGYIICLDILTKNVIRNCFFQYLIIKKLILIVAKIIIRNYLNSLS